MLIGAARAQSQDAPPPPPSGAPGQGQGMGPGMGRGPGGMNNERMLDMMTKRLNLNEDQKSQVKTILDDRRKQMQALRQDTTIAQDDKRPKVMGIMQTSNDKIKAVLNDDQKKEFDTMMQEMRQRRNGPGGGPGAGPGAGPQNPPPPPATPPQQ